MSVYNYLDTFFHLLGKCQPESIGARGLLIGRMGTRTGPWQT
jgi:hypothetical protein